MAVQIKCRPFWLEPAISSKVRSKISSSRFNKRPRGSLSANNSSKHTIDDVTVYWRCQSISFRSHQISFRCLLTVLKKFEPSRPTWYIQFPSCGPLGTQPACFRWRFIPGPNPALSGLELDAYLRCCGWWWWRHAHVGWRRWHADWVWVIDGSTTCCLTSIYSHALHA